MVHSIVFKVDSLSGLRYVLHGLHGKACRLRRLWHLDGKLRLAWAIN